MQARYFVIKNYPFTDGNKRIEFRADGSQRFDDNALVAVALLVAGSDPKRKDIGMRLIMAMLS